jgi:hypothetical protein
MPEHLHYDDEAIVNRDTHHEESDVNVRPLVIFVVIFVIFAAVTQVGLWLMFKMFKSISDRPNAPLTQMALPPDMNVPAEPRLQPFPSKDATAHPPNTNTPVTDMIDMRANEEKVLQHYGWVDQSKGIVHIPIAEAKQRLLQTGLPVAGPSTPGTGSTTTTSNAVPAPMTPAAAAAATTSARAGSVRP